MDSSGLLFATALIASLSATELVRVLALRLGAMDRPGGRRVHLKPTARLGGLGIFWGFAVAMMLAAYLDHAFHAAAQASLLGFLAVLAGAGLMLITGLLDDVHGLSAAPKLLIQCSAASLVYLAGWRVETLGLPGVGAVAVGPWGFPLTVGWIVVVTNALNLIDGLDGLACGVALIAAVAIAAMLGPDAHVSRSVAIALGGALLGFLWFNLHPALIFMGDAGSLFVGFLLASITVRSGAKLGHGTFPLVAALVLAVPLFDTSSAVVRRLVLAARAARTPLGFLREARGRLMKPDRAHVHHRLLDAGCSMRLAVIVLWLAAAAMAGCAWLVSRQPLPGLVATAVCAVLGGIGYARLAPDARRRRAVRETSHAARVTAPPPMTAVETPPAFDDAEALAGLEAERQVA